MDAKLVVVGGEAQATEYSLSLPAVIGRSRNADIKVGQALVSRKHCELYEEDGQLVVRDLGSLNGTFVGDARIADPTFLPPGAMLTVGSVTFQAVYGDMSEEPLADADTAGAMPEFMAAPVAAKATSIEQTMEMTDEEEPAPLTEDADAGDREEGFDFGWLDDGAEGEEAADDKAVVAEAAKAEPRDDQYAEAEVEEEAEAEVEAELDLPDPEQDGEAEGAHVTQEHSAGGDDDNNNLDDFFANLK